MPLSQVPTNPRSFERGGISISHAQVFSIYRLLSHMLPGSDFKTTAKSERKYVRAPRDSLSVTVCMTLVYLPLVSTVSACPSATILLLLSRHLSPSLHTTTTGAALSSGIPHVAPLGGNSSRSQGRALLSPRPTVAVPLAPVSRGHQSANRPPPAPPLL